jgi:hypothetical protein
LALPRATSQPKALQKGKGNRKDNEGHESYQKKTKQTETSPAQGQSPAKEQSLAKGPGILKRPSSILKLPKNEADLSLEQKMEAFQRKPMEMFRLSLTASPLAREKPFGVALAGQGMP